MEKELRRAITVEDIFTREVATASTARAAEAKYALEALVSVRATKY